MNFVTNQQLNQKISQIKNHIKKGIIVAQKKLDFQKLLYIEKLIESDIFNKYFLMTRPFQYDNFVQSQIAVGTGQNTAGAGSHPHSNHLLETSNGNQSRLSLKQKINQLLGLCKEENEGIKTQFAQVIGAEKQILDLMKQEFNQPSGYNNYARSNVEMFPGTNHLTSISPIQQNSGYYNNEGQNKPRSYQSFPLYHQGGQTGFQSGHHTNYPQLRSQGTFPQQNHPGSHYSNQNINNGQGIFSQGGHRGQGYPQKKHMPGSGAHQQGHQGAYYQNGQYIPGQQGYYSSTDGQYIPGHQGHYIPGQQGQYIQGHQGQYIPGQQGQYIPGQQGYYTSTDGQYVPGQFSQYTPGQQGQYIPGQRGSYIAGQQGQYIPGQQGQYIPGTQGHFIPGQSQQILSQGGRRNPQGQGQYASEEPYGLQDTQGYHPSERANILKSKVQELKQQNGRLRNLASQAQIPTESVDPETRHLQQQVFRLRNLIQDYQNQLSSLNNNPKVAKRSQLLRQLKDQGQKIRQDTIALLRNKSAPSGTFLTGGAGGYYGSPDLSASGRRGGLQNLNLEQQAHLQSQLNQLRLECQQLQNEGANIKRLSKGTNLTSGSRRV